MSNGLRLVHQACDFDCPRARDKSAGRRSNAALFGIKLVKVVVVRDVFNEVSGSFTLKPFRIASSEGHVITPAIFGCSTTAAGGGFSLR